MIQTEKSGALKCRNDQTLFTSPRSYDARGNGDGETACTITADHERRITDYTALVLDTTQITSPQDGSRPRPGGPCQTLEAKGHPPALVIATGQANAEVTEGKAPALNCNHEAPIVFSKEAYNAGEKADFDPYIKESGPAPTLRADHQPPGVCSRYIVRRLTPLECERLQGYPDGWTDIGDWTDSKGRTRSSADAARYKALGNSIALPPWAWVLKRLCACYERPATMASLFDGIGGFPLLWERLNGPGTCLWASEVEEFCIAVTKRRFAGGFDR